MERRKARVLVGAFLAFACGCGRSDPPARLTAGAPVPAEWRVGGAGAGAVVWVFRTEDCLSCIALDYPLRRLGRSRTDVALVTVHVGRPEDAEIPRAYLASRRLEPAATVELTPRQFRRRFGDANLPMLLLAHRDTILWSNAEPGQGPITLPGIDSLFDRYLARTDTARPQQTAAAPRKMVQPTVPRRSQ